MRPELPPELTIDHRYRILDILGEGNSGVTYRAERLSDGTIVALKVLSLRGSQNWKLVELFEREAQVLQSLDHPAIPRYLESFIVDTADDRHFYIAQTLAEGKNLAQWVEAGWRPTEAAIRDLAMQVLAILQYLQGLNPPIVHRDLKPQNLIRRDDGQIFLVDFGAVAHTYHNTLMRGSTVVGTFGYMAPEQFRSQAYPATDLYGLGATILFILTRRSPAELPTTKLRLQFRDKLRVSEAFCEWLEQLVEPDRKLRLGNALEAIAAFPKSGQLAPWQKVLPQTNRLVMLGGAIGLMIAMIVGGWQSHYGILRLLGQQATLYEALETDKIKLADYLDRGGRWGLQNQDYRQFISIALIQKNYQLAEKFLQSNRQPIETIDPFLLSKIIKSSQPTLAVEILERYIPNLDWNRPDPKGEIPLLLTTNEDVALFLLKRGANPQVTNQTGQSFLFIASERGWEKVTADLLKQDRKLLKVAGNSRITAHVVEKRQAEILKQLVQAGARLSQQDIQQMSFDFSLSSFYDSTNKRNWLVEAIPDLNWGDKHGNTLLHHIVSSRDYDALLQLLAKKVDVHKRNRKKETALFKAQESSAIEYLIKAGANINDLDGRSRNQLHRLAEDCSIQRCFEMVKTSIKLGINVNQISQDDETPLDTVDRQLRKMAERRQHSSDRNSITYHEGYLQEMRSLLLEQSARKNRQ